LTIFLFLAGASFAGLAVTDWTLSQATFTPGSNGIVTISVSNPSSTGTAAMVNTVNMEMITPPEILMTGQQFIGDIEPGGITKVSIPFQVKESAKSGIYTVDFKITGVADRTTGGFDTFSRTASIPITVVNQPILNLRSDKEVIGGIDSIMLTITDNGGAASKLRVSIPSGTGQSSAVAFFGIDQLYVPRVDENSALTINVTLDSRDAQDGATNIPIYLQYEDELGMAHKDNTSLRITVRNEKVDLKFMQQSDVITKKESTLALQIHNDGTETLRDVQLSFQNGTTVRLKDQSEMKFGDIAPGGSATASVVVMADLPPGVNLVDTQLTWIEKDIQREENRKVPITITSDADVGVFLEAKPSPLTTGGEHTISVLVSNLGSYPIDNVAVRFSSDAMDMLDISQEQYIGSLNNDDFSTVQFKVKVKQVPQGDYPVTVNVTYRDQSGEWKTKSMVRPVSVFQPPSGGLDPLLFLPIIAIAAIGLWWFRFRKKPQKQNQDNGQ